MRCRKVRSFLSTYCREETPAELSARIKEHLTECSSCRREEAAYRSVNKIVAGLPQKTSSDDFNAKLFQRIGQEGFAEKRTKAYFPKRAPRFGTSKLAAVASVAVIILALGIGLNLEDALFNSNGQQMAGTTSVTTLDDRYLTAQPEDNPLLNEHKSVSKRIAQYNRWREFSKLIRTGLEADQIMGGPSASFASSTVIGAGSPHIMVRPVSRDYLRSPE